ncbi:thioesterase II family protein [Streptomyces sp. NPDC002324]
MSERWTSVIRPASGTRLTRLVVLPHSGSGPNALLPLLRLLPPTVEVVGVTLPGRERRFAESCAGVADDPGGVLREVLSELTELLRLPTFFFGHSMGAVFAAALAVQAPDLCGGLVLSAYPGDPPAARRPEILTDEELLDIVCRGERTPDDALNDPMVREHVLRVMRCDLALEHRLAEWIAERRLPVAPTVLGGRTDLIVAPEELAGWTARAPVGVREQVFPGGHFYLLDEPNMAAVASEIVAAMASGRPRGEERELRA